MPSIDPTRLHALDVTQTSVDGSVGSFIGASKRFVFTDEIRDKISRSRRGIPVPPERRAKISASLTGLKQSPETIEKRRQKMIGHACSPETRAKLSRANKGHVPWIKGKKRGPMSTEQRLQASLSRRGIPNLKLRGLLSPAWKGGRTALRNQIENSIAYHKWRSDIFSRDNYTCWDCGIRGNVIHAHHVRNGFAAILDEYNIKTLEQALACVVLWDLSNGITLCSRCHSRRHHRPITLQRRKVA